MLFLYSVPSGINLAQRVFPYVPRDVMVNIQRYLSLYLSVALQPSDLGRFFSFLILYTVGRTLWTGVQPVARPLSTHKRPCLEWDSNPLSQHSSERRQRGDCGRLTYKAKNVKSHHAIKSYGGVDVSIHVFLTSVLVGGES
jgi:hypothetical protein